MYKSGGGTLGSPSWFLLPVNNRIEIMSEIHIGINHSVSGTFLGGTVFFIVASICKICRLL